MSFYLSANLRIFKVRLNLNRLQIYLYLIMYNFYRINIVFM